MSSIRKPITLVSIGLVLALAVAAFAASTLSKPAQAQTAERPFTAIGSPLGRKVVSYTAGSASWVASAQLNYGDTYGNPLGWDAERGRCAVKEGSGLKGVRIHRCYVQQWFDPDGSGPSGERWNRVLINEVDRASYANPAYAVSFTPVGLMCTANPTLKRWTQVVNPHAVRRSDDAVFQRVTASYKVLARALSTDPGCVGPTPPPPTSSSTTTSTTSSSTTTSTTLAPAANLEIDAQGPATLQHSQTADLNVLVTNATASAGTVTAVVNFSNDLTVTNVDDRCVAITTGTDPNDFTCNLGVMAAGASANLDFDVRGDTVGAQSVVATVSGTGTSDTDSDTLTINVVASADLSVDKSAAPTESATDPTNVYAFTFVARNTGPDTATGVTVTDAWPAHLGDPTVPTACVFNDTADTLTCTPTSGDLTASGTGSVETFVVTAPVLGDGTNTAVISGAQADPNEANNTDSVTLNI